MEFRFQPPVQEQLFSNEAVPYIHEYTILATPDGPGSEELRENYAHLTDKLIHRVQTEKPDFLVFLDKSARPVAWLMKELWPLMAKNEKGEILPMPEIKFLNIDREQWVDEVEDFDSGIIDVNRVNPKAISNLRSIFTDRVVDSDEENTMDSPSFFDDKKIMVVDEVQVTGRTLAIATGLLSRAFPKSKITKTHWMKPGKKIVPGQPSRNADLPVWYSDEKVTGRGIANRDDAKSASSPSRRQQRGSRFLSTRFRTVDMSSRELRTEFKHLARDVEEGRLVVLPDVTRDDFSEQFLRINGITPEEFY